MKVKPVHARREGEGEEKYHHHCLVGEGMDTVVCSIGKVEKVSKYTLTQTMLHSSTVHAALNAQ